VGRGSIRMGDKLLEEMDVDTMGSPLRFNQNFFASKYSIFQYNPPLQLML
jgi:hypothetical protein